MAQYLESVQWAQRFVSVTPERQPLGDQLPIGSGLVTEDEVRNAARKMKKARPVVKTVFQLNSDKLRCHLAVVQQNGSHTYVKHVGRQGACLTSGTCPEWQPFSRRAIRQSVATIGQFHY